MLEKKFCLSVMRKVNESALGEFCLSQMPAYHHLKPDILTVDQIEGRLHGYEYETIEAWFNDIETYYQTFAKELSTDSHMGLILLTLLQMYRDELSHRYDVEESSASMDLRSLVRGAIDACPNSIEDLRAERTATQVQPRPATAKQTTPLFSAHDMIVLQRHLTNIKDPETRSRVVSIIQCYEPKTKETDGRLTFDLNELSPYSLELLMNVVKRAENRGKL